MARIGLRGVSKYWDKARAVQHVDLQLEDGEFVAILGPSGCGKSTTLLLLAGIYSPSGGDILFDGARVNDVEARDRNVGIVFQSYALYPNMSVLQNIMFPLRFQNIKRQAAESSAREIAELVQISDLLGRRPSELSGGQQQRVALARALVKKPHLLLLDEPLSNLDATLRLTMRTEIKRIQRETGVTTVLVTHDQIEATTMADRIVCMNLGRIEQIGPPDALYRMPATTFVASFIGSPPINMLSARSTEYGLTVDQQRLNLQGQSCQSLPQELVFGIRPEHIRAIESGISAVIKAAEPLGRETLYTAQTSLGELRFLEATPAPRFAPDEHVSLKFEAADTLVFDAQTSQRLDGLHAHV